MLVLCCEGQSDTEDTGGHSGYIWCRESGRNIFSRVPSLDLYLSETWLYQEIYTIYTHLHWRGQVGTVFHTQLHSTQLNLQQICKAVLFLFYHGQLI